MKIKTAFPYAGLLIMLVATAASGQVKPRVVDLGKQYDNQPLKVLGCQIGQLSFADCSRIEADTDWWQNIKFIVKNVSSKTISYYSTSFEIPKQGGMRYASLVNLLVEGGPVALVDDAGKPTGRWGVRIEPGDVVMFKPPLGEPKHWRDSLHLKDVDDLEKISLYLRYFYFTDGTTWAFGKENKIRSGQTDDLSRKLITHKIYEKVLPITVTQLEANGRTIKPNEPFITTEPEWLKDFKITFQNNTERTIKSVIFYLTLLEGHPMSPPTGEPIAYGVRLFRGPDDKRIAGSLEPGMVESAIIEQRFYDSLLDHDHTWIDMAQQTTAEIYLDEIIFVDGVKWSHGCYHKPDPERRNQWLSDCIK